MGIISRAFCVLIVFVLAASCLIVNESVGAQSNPVYDSEIMALQWTKTYGVYGFEGKTVIQTNDKGFFIVADSIFNGSEFILKTDADGNLLWRKDLDVNSPNTTLTSAVQTGDDGYALAGSVVSEEGEKGFLLKLDSEGNVEWSKTFQFYFILFSSTVDGGFSSLIQTNDGGYALVGRYSLGEPMYGNAAYTYFVKTDALGNLLLNETIDSHGPFYPVSLVQNNAGDFVFMGGFPAQGFSHSCMELVEVNPNGATLWINLYEVFEPSYAASGIATSDGGYLVGGKGRLSNDLDTGLLLMINGRGEMVWNQTYSDIPNVQSLLETENNYILFGNDGYVQIESSGKVKSNFTTFGLDGVVKSIVANSQGGFTVTGVGNSQEGFAATGYRYSAVLLAHFSMTPSASPTTETTIPSPGPTNFDSLNQQSIVAIAVASVAVAVVLGVAVYLRKRRC
jgi:hypothetical protein